ncbi:hypothetical protein SALBM217S_07475 [Streptomyces griseoloalbus]
MMKHGESTVATAIVSPSARPRPSIEAEMMPERPNGSTARRMTSQRVAPRARAASSCICGTWRKTSRLTLVMIGRIMIASRMPTVSSERAAPGLAKMSGPAEEVVEPEVQAVHVRDEDEGAPEAVDDGGYGGEQVDDVRDGGGQLRGA